jgi:putative DNA primase/helicase
VAAKLWAAAATPAQADHPYLERKRVAPTDRLRELGADRVREIAGYSPQHKGETLQGRILLAPVEIETPKGRKVSSLELIDEAGRKSALAGGQKAGGFRAAQTLPEGDGEGMTLLIGEGAATVLSASQASGFPAAGALSSGNLEKVALAMRARCPKAALILLADLDKETGAADPHAIQAARAVGGILAVPRFQEGHGPERKDFNDLAVKEGPEAVKAIVLEALAGAAREHGERGFHLATREKPLSPAELGVQIDALPSGDDRRRAREILSALEFVPSDAAIGVIVQGNGNTLVLSSGPPVPGVRNAPNESRPSANYRVRNAKSRR